MEPEVNLEHSQVCASKKKAKTIKEELSEEIDTPRLWYVCECPGLIYKTAIMGFGSRVLPTLYWV